jgi:transcriptional regulator with XRE-family HTH domain
MPSPARQSIVATRLRVLRAQHPEISQVTLAELVGVSQHAVSRWEMGKIEPRAALLAKLCDVYGVSADYLLGRTDSPTGLSPGTWIVDLEKVAAPVLKEKWAAEVPRRHRIVDHAEMLRIEEKTNREKGNR